MVGSEIQPPRSGLSIQRESKLPFPKAMSLTCTVPAEVPLLFPKLKSTSIAKRGEVQTAVHVDQLANGVNNKRRSKGLNQGGASIGPIALP